MTCKTCRTPATWLSSDGECFICMTSKKKQQGKMINVNEDHLIDLLTLLDRPLIPQGRDAEEILKDLAWKIRQQKDEVAGRLNKIMVEAV